MPPLLRVVTLTAAATVALASGAAGHGAIRPSGPSPTVARPLPLGLVTPSGQVATLGGAAFEGDLATAPPRSPVVGLAAAPGGRGYWLAERDGQVLAFGTARGGRRAGPPGAPPAVAVVAAPSGGCWVVDAGGGVHPVGAPALGGPPLPRQRGPVVAAAAGPDGLLLLTSGGTLVARRAAPGPAAAGPAPLPSGTAAAAVVAGPRGRGAWVITASGRVVALAGAPPLAAATGADRSPVVAAVPGPGGRGLLVVRRDGVVAGLGGAAVPGSLWSPLHPPLYPARFQPPPTVVAGAAALARGPLVATRPARVVFLGDSQSALVGRYTGAVLARGGDLRAFEGGIPGCGVTGGLLLGTFSGRRPPAPTLPACADWRQQYQRALDLWHPSVVVLLTGYWESQRHVLPGHGAVTVATSAPYRAYLAARLRAVAAMVRAAGAVLVVATSPLDGDGTPAADVEAFNRLLRTTLAGAAVVDLEAVLDPGGRFATVVDGVTARSTDGVHVTPAGVERVVDPVLVPVLRRAAHLSAAGPPAPHRT